MTVRVAVPPTDWGATSAARRHLAAGPILGTPFAAGPVLGGLYSVGRLKSAVFS